MSPEIYAVPEPVHHLLAQMTNAFVARQIAREVGRQIATGTSAERLRHRADGPADRDDVGPDQ